MELEKAKEIALELCSNLETYCHKLMIVGSIRRNKPEVRDIDIVCIPISKIQLPYNSRIIRNGEKIIAFIHKGMQIDLYLSTEQTFETLVLIRTGSINHNKKLCTIAKEKGWKLKASGEGLIDGEGKIIANTEKSILETLLGQYVEPEMRI